MTFAHLEGKDVGFIRMSEYPIPSTTWTREHQDIVEAISYFQQAAPEALFTLCQQLSEGRTLTARGEKAIRSILNLDGSTNITFCPSCYLPLIGTWSLFEHGDVDTWWVGEVEYGFRGGMGPGGVDTCAKCHLDPDGFGDNGETPRFLIHPQQWSGRGYRPSDLGDPADI